MKRFFIAMMLLLASVASASLVSCKKETKYSAEQQQVKLDEVGAEFIGQLDLDNWKSTFETVVPALLLLDTLDMSEVDLMLARQDTVFNSKKTSATVTQVLDFSQIKGHFTVEKDSLAVPVKGDFNDFQIEFASQGHNYVAQVVITNSTSKILIDSTTRSYGGYDIKKGDKWEWHSVEGGFTKQSFFYLIVPEKFTVNITADGSKPFSIESKLDYKGPQDFTVVPDFNEITIGASGVLKAGDYSLNLSKLNFGKRDFAENFYLKRGNKTLLQLNSSAKQAYYANDTTAANQDFHCKSASLTLNILGKVQAKGSLKFDELYPKFMALPDTVATIEEGNAKIAELKPYYDLGLYYNGGKTKQAWIDFEYVLPEEEAEPKSIIGDKQNGYTEMEPVPVVKFLDGTKYVATDFFSPDNFTRTLEAYEAFMTKIEDYFIEVGLKEKKEELKPLEQ